MNKKIVGAFIAAALVLSIGVGMSFAAPNLGNSLAQNQNGVGPPDVLPVMKGNPHQFKQLKLMYAMDMTTDPIVWTHVSGNEVSGFKLCLDPTVEYYYLDIMKLKPYPFQALEDPYYYPFYVDPESLSEEYLNDWETKIATFPAEWQDIATKIFVSGEVPIFFLKVDSGVYMLVDGFEYWLYNNGNPTGLASQDNPLRVNGDYTLGTYTYLCEELDVSMTMTFRTCECDDCQED